MKNKVIGLIGGISPESTLRYYEYCFRGMSQALGAYNTGTIIIYSLDLHDTVSLIDSGDWRGLSLVVKRAEKHLQDAGADFVVICCNTFHKILQLKPDIFELPVLSIFAPINEHIKSNHYKRIGLLGTKATMQDGFYQEGLRESGAEIIIPDDADVEMLHDVIFKYLTNGDFKNPVMFEVFKKITDKFVAQKVDAIILGCTELPIAFESIKISIPTIDTLRLHCSAIVHHSIGSNNEKTKSAMLVG